MGPGDSIPGFSNAQYRYDMHYDQAKARFEARREDIVGQVLAEEGIDA